MLEALEEISGRWEMILLLRLQRNCRTTSPEQPNTPRWGGGGGLSGTLRSSLMIPPPPRTPLLSPEAYELCKSKLSSRSVPSCQERSFRIKPLVVVSTRLECRVFSCFDEFIRLLKASKKHVCEKMRFFFSLPNNPNKLVIRSHRVECWSRSDYENQFNEIVKSVKSCLENFLDSISCVCFCCCF